MNNSILFRELPPLNLLFKKRVQHLRERLYNLKIDDVATEERYTETLDFIKTAILLQPVSVDAPVLEGIRNSGGLPLMSKLTGRLKGAISPVVNFSFTGSRELFSVATNSVNLKSGTPIFQPKDGYLTVKPDAIFFSRYEALDAALSLLKPTLEVIDANNTEVITWRARIEKRIEQKVLAFREEHKDLYPPNELLSAITNL